MLSLLVAGMFALGAPTDCRPRARGPSESPYTPSGALALAGRYHLTLVATAGRPGWNASGLLELMPADSTHRYTVAPLSGVGPRRPGLDRPLWGYAELTGNLVGDLSELARRDPDHPAAVLLAEGRLLLTWPRPTIFHLELNVERVSAGGFRGRWTTHYGLTPTIFTGPNEGPIAGYFCATLRPGA